jgi:hypothetical protein
MARPYSQDLRDRDAVVLGGMSRRGGCGALWGQRIGCDQMGRAFRANGFADHWKHGRPRASEARAYGEFLEACHAEKPDVTPRASELISSESNAVFGILRSGFPSRPLPAFASLKELAQGSNPAVSTNGAYGRNVRPLKDVKKRTPKSADVGGEHGQRS